MAGEALSLQTLPPEMRNRIYEFVAPPIGRAVCYLDVTSSQAPHVDCDLPPFGLIQTCRMLRKEYRSMQQDYYDHGTTPELRINCYFPRGGLEESLHWLQNIGPTVQRSLGIIQVCVSRMCCVRISRTSHRFPLHHFFFAAYEEAIRSVRPQGFHLRWHGGLGLHEILTTGGRTECVHSDPTSRSHYRVRIVEGPDPRTARQRKKESGFDDCRLGADNYHEYMKRQEDGP